MIWFYSTKIKRNKTKKKFILKTSSFQILEYTTTSGFKKMSYRYGIDFNYYF